MEEKTLVRKKRTMITHGKVKTFLKHLERTGNFNASAGVIDVVPRALYAAMKRDPKFAAAVEAAKNRSVYEIEMELRRRGLDGVEEEIYHNGVVVGTKIRYSDRLLELLAKGNIERYRRTEEGNSVNINIGGESIKNKLASLLGVEIEDKNKPSDDDIIEGEFIEMP
jgi:hypothetical protein